jgi:hypothetical protein
MWFSLKLGVLMLYISFKSRSKSRNLIAFDLSYRFLPFQGQSQALYPVSDNIILKGIIVSLSLKHFQDQ